MLKTRLLTASALATVAVLAIPTAAFAQAGTTPEANAADPTKVPDDSNADGTTNDKANEVVVTGSRIRRSTFNSPDPVTVISRDESTAAGFNSTSEILQSNAVTGGTDQINDTYGGFVVNGGPGVNTISLRGLGTTRTLVLLDGRRVAPAGSRGAVGTTDLNVLPNAAIDRVEVLNTGASSIYGSDAVAGVINIITRSNVKGLNLEAQHNFLEDGAGTSRRYSAVAGFRSGGLKIMGSAEFYKRDVLTNGDRSFTQCPTQYYGTDGTNFGAGDFIDPKTGQAKCFPLENGGVTLNTIGTTNYAGNTVALAPGVPAGYTGICNRFRPNPLVTTGALPGYECVGGGTLSTNIRDTSSPTLLQKDLISPVKIYTGFAKISYESNILGGAEFYTSILANRRKSSQNGSRQFTIDYPQGSPLLPANLRNAAFLAPQGQVPYTTALRVFADYGIYNNRQTVDFVRLNGGVRGDLPGGFRYDAFIGKTWSDATYTTDLILADRLAQSLQVNAAGTACTNTLGGCVAAPALSASVIGGRFAQQPALAAWFDFVTDPVVGTTKYRETTYSLNVDGPLFSLPGGEVQVALGAEYRKASINDQPSPESVRNNLYGFTSSTPTVGKDSVYELFGELEVPILHDSFIYDLTLNGSGRYTHYKSYGGDQTYKVGGNLSPVRGLSFRGSYGTSYRAPALYEQFLGATSGFLSNTTDPCDQLASQTNPLILQQCAADGLPTNFTQNNSITVVGVGGAAAGLKSETSKALTFGGVLEPRFGEKFGQLSIAADYFKVKIDNGVSQLTAATVLSQCYNNPQRTTCNTGLITRSPYTGPGTGQLRVIQSYVNISDAVAEGIDYTLRYTHPLLGGQFRLGAQLTQYLERYSRQLPTQTKLDVIGLIENPEWTGTFDVNFAKNGWNLRYGLEWVDATDSQAYALSVSPAFTTAKYKFTTPDYFLHSLSLRYDMDKFGFTFGVRNLFDKDPPKISTDYTNTLGNTPLYSGYDIRGRQFFVNVRAGF